MPKTLNDSARRSARRRAVLGRAAAALTLAGWLVPAPQRAEDFRLFCGVPADNPKLTLLSKPCAASPSGGSDFTLPTPDISVLGVPKQPNFWVNDATLVDGRVLAFTAAGLGLLVYGSWDEWWKDAERVPLHVNNDGWFGQDTYAGGADKVSHFVVSSIATQVTSDVYQLFGKRSDGALWVAAGFVSLGGLIVELGDGVTEFGFSWHDLAMNFAGAVTGVGLKRTGWDDTLGFRIGPISYTPPPTPPIETEEGPNYSREIYTMDLKLAGVLPRMGLRPGISRYLLLSVTYGTQGYREDLYAENSRNLGLEVGLNLPEILRALGVRDASWWGKPLLAALTYIRVPYTAIGFQVDLNK